MSTREIILRTRKNKLFNFNTQSVEDALGIYIKDILGFNRGFEMSEAAWQALNNLATSKPLSVKLDLINGLCKFSRDKIDEIIVGSSSYPTITQDTIIYQVAENNTYAAVSGCIDNTATSIIISDKYDGLPISSIKSSAFQDQKNLVTIEIPNSMLDIGFRAFFGCSALKKLALPDTVTNISRQAFVDTAIYNDETNWENGVLYINNHLVAADRLQIGNSYVVKPGTKTISEQAFNNCETLTQITLPDGLISINKEAFNNCNKITEFIIPNSVTSIGSMAVHNCKALTQITLPFIGSGTRLDDSEYTHIGWIFGAGSYASNQYVLPSTLKSIIITAPCKRIDDNAFYGCSKLTNIIIPDNTTSIGKSAFECCSSLEKAIIPKGISTIKAKTFYDCQALIDVWIPSTVNSIEKNAFENCGNLRVINYFGTEDQWNNLKVSSGNNALLEARTKYFRANSGQLGTDITFYRSPLDTINIEGTGQLYNFEEEENESPFYYDSTVAKIKVDEGITSIGDYAFYSCSLNSISLPNSLTHIGNYAFRGLDAEVLDLSNLANLTSIGDYAFCDAYMTSVHLPNSLISLGEGAFYECSDLASIELSSPYLKKIEDHAFERTVLTELDLSNLSSLEAIGNDAFKDCSDLTAINLPKNTLKEIGTGAFESTNLTEIDLSNTKLEKISDQAFDGCRSLKTISLPGTLKEIGDSAFERVGLTTIDFSKTKLKKIGNEAFRLAELTELNLSGTQLEEIGDSAFQFAKLVMVDLSSTQVEKISDNVFGYCRKLETVSLPNALKKIGTNAFEYCEALKTISIPSTLTKIEENAFYKCSVLDTINYNGTQQQWNEISGINNIPTSAKIIFSST